MTKRLLALLLCLVLVVLLVGCGKKKGLYDDNPYLTPTLKEMFSDNDNVELVLVEDKEIIGTPIGFATGERGELDSKRAPGVVMVKSTSEVFEKFVDNEYTKKYTDEFFETKNLLVIYKSLNHGADDYPATVDSLTKDGDKLYINMTFTDISFVAFVTDEVSHHVICVEVDKSDVQEITTFETSVRYVQAKFKENK